MYLMRKESTYMLGGQMGRFLSDEGRGCLPGDKRWLLSKMGMGCLLSGGGGCWMVEQSSFSYFSGIGTLKGSFVTPSIGDGGSDILQKK